MFTQCKCQWFSFWKAGMKAWVMLGVSWQICTMLTLSHSWGWEDINEETFTFPQTVVIIKPSGTPNLSLGKWLCSLIDCLGSHWFSLELIWLFGWEIWFMFHIWVKHLRNWTISLWNWGNGGHQPEVPDGYFFVKHCGWDVWWWFWTWSQ